MKEWDLNEHVNFYFSTLKSENEEIIWQSMPSSIELNRLKLIGIISFIIGFILMFYLELYLYTPIIFFILRPNYLTFLHSFLYSLIIFISLSFLYISGKLFIQNRELKNTMYLITTKQILEISITEMNKLNRIYFIELEQIEEIEINLIEKRGIIKEIIYYSTEVAKDVDLKNNLKNFDTFSIVFKYITDYQGLFKALTKSLPENLIEDGFNKEISTLNSSKSDSIDDDNFEKNSRFISIIIFSIGGVLSIIFLSYLMLFYSQYYRIAGMCYCGLFITDLFRVCEFCIYISLMLNISIITIFLLRNWIKSRFDWQCIYLIIIFLSWIDLIGLIFPIDFFFIPPIFGTTSFLWFVEIYLPFYYLLIISLLLKVIGGISGLITEKLSLVKKS